MGYIQINPMRPAVNSQPSLSLATARPHPFKPMKTKPIMTSSFKPTALIAAVALLAANFGVQAAPRTWSGGAGDNNWGTAGNWGGTALDNIRRAREAFGHGLR